jgi:hypothetical protein
MIVAITLPSILFAPLVKFETTMNKTYTHTGLVSKEVDFGKRTQSKRDFRETKHHFISSNGDKFCHL